MIKEAKGEGFIYLDHNATTPLDPEVREAMIPYLGEEFGNPSSGYALGKRSKEGLECARAEVASLLGCGEKEILFTSGGSEANNMVLKGLVDFGSPEKFHLITSAVEHPAILNPALYLMELGAQVTVLPVNAMGRVDPEAVRRAIRSDTSLISIMLANNETGTLQPVKEISHIARRLQIPLHTDAAQAVGKVPVDVNDLGVDFLSLAGHKLYGPKGVGALYIRDGLHLTPLIHGAGQEGGRRAGTESPLLAAGLGAACRTAKERLEGEMLRMKGLRDRLEERLFSRLEGLVLNGDPELRLPNTLNFCVPGLEGAEILEGTPTLFASTGAACHARNVKLSHVLSAMGVPPEIGMGALRLTVGRSNTMDQIDQAVDWIVERVERMRNGSRE
jgi:cysteine desulfurase